MKKLALIPLSLGILFGVWLSETEAGGRWISNTTHAPYRVDQVCQDGVQVSIVNVTRGDLNQLAVDSSVTIQPPIIFKGDIADAWSHRPTDLDPPLAKEYFNVIGAGQFVTVGAADFKSDPVEYQGFDEHYHTTVTLPFFQRASVGQTVGVGNSTAMFELNSNHLHLVEDCRYFEYTADAPQTISQNEVAPDYDGFDPSLMVFQVTELPTTGDIFLNGTTQLMTNGQFTLAELTEGGEMLNYVPSTLGLDDAALKVMMRGTKRVSLNSEGEQLDSHSFDPTISADGRYIAFASLATNTLSDGAGGFINTNSKQQIYKFDLRFNKSSPASYSFSNQFADEHASLADISPDGAGVAFVSQASDLLSNAPRYCFGSDINDTNGVQDVFFAIDSGIYRPSMFRFDDPADNFNCKELSISSTMPSAADSRAVRTGSASFSGRQVAFQTAEPIDAPDYSDTNGTTDIILFSDSYTEWVAREPNFSLVFPTPIPIIPPIIPRESDSIETNQALQTSAPLIINAPNDSSSRADISADANVIAFESNATNLIKSLFNINLDTNGFTDVFVSKWNGSGWIQSRISVTSEEEQAVNGISVQPSVSQFGDHIAFTSIATNLDPAADGSNFQIFVRDQQAGCTTLLSKSDVGMVGNGLSQLPSISGNGRFVSFQSAATNLIDNDTNGEFDIFVVDRDADEDGQFYSDADNCIAGPSHIFRVSVAADGSQSNDTSFQSAISLNGEFVTFASNATNLVPNDTNGVSDVFIHYIGHETTIEFKAGTANLYLPVIVPGD